MKVPLLDVNAQNLPLEEELEQIRSVTLDDLRAVASAYPLKPTTTGTLRPA